MIVNIHAAKTNLSKLIERAEAGEEVIIARAGSPRVRLDPIVAKSARPKKGAWLDSMRGRIKFKPGWDQTSEELIRQTERGPIFPRDEPNS
jgi:prevent-host-death family protein